MHAVRHYAAHPLNAFAVLVLLLLLAAPSRVFAQGQSAKDWLLTDPPGNSAAASAAARKDTAVTRQKPFVLNHGLLQAAISKGGGIVSVTLLDGTTIDIKLERVEQRAQGNFTWYGTVAGSAGSQVVLTSVQGQVSGSIAFGNQAASYQIRPGANGAHWLQQLDQRAFPPDHPNGDVPRAPKTSSPQDVGSGMTASGITAQGTAAGVTIDVMIVWSNQSASAAGVGIASEAQNAVDTANTVYANSGINTVLRLVYAGPASYDESGDYGTDLNRLSGTKDGFMDGVHALRDQYGADMVSLFVESSQYCGISYIGPSASYAFTVVNRGCASGNYSYVHELGHATGSLHDPYMDPSTSPYSYGHGYVNVDEHWRTVMAYNNQCAAANTNCTRVAYFSNPLATYSATGSVMGTTGSSSTPTADNVKVHNQNALTVAAFRNAVTPGCSYTLSPASASVPAASGSGSFNVTSGSGCAWNASSTSPWLGVSTSSGTSGTGILYYTVAANAGPARSATITVGNQTFTVSQASGCTFAVSPGSASYAASGGTGSITVTTGAGCTWSTSSGASWVNKISPASGSGSATVTYSVDANSQSSSRTGNLNVGPATFTVTEAAATVVNGTPSASLSPASLGFGNVNTGKKSSVQTATFTNTGTGTLTISGVADGGDTAQFARGGTCAAGASLAPGTSCTITYQFAPKLSGSFTATTTVTSNASTAPSVTATGTGKFRGK